MKFFSNSLKSDSLPFNARVPKFLESTKKTGPITSENTSNLRTGPRACLILILNAKLSGSRLRNFRYNKRKSIFAEKKRTSVRKMLDTSTKINRPSLMVRPTAIKPALQHQNHPQIIVIPQSMLASNGIKTVFSITDSQNRQPTVARVIKPSVPLVSI